MGTALAGGGGYLIYSGISDIRRPYQGRVRVGFTIAKRPQEIYDFLSDAQNWNHFLHGIHLESRGDGRLRLAIGKPGRLDFESRIEVTDRKPGEYIAWASADQMFEHRGVTNFKQAPATAALKSALHWNTKLSLARSPIRWLRSRAGIPNR